MENFEVKESAGQMEEIVSAGQLLKILNSSPKEVSTLCQKACLKPKKDNFGNIYFSKDDIDVLRKVKELYQHTKELQEEKKRAIQEAVKKMDVKKEEAEEEKITVDLKLRPKQKDFLPKHKKIQTVDAPQTSAPVHAVAFGSQTRPALSKGVQALENNIVDRISKVINEKMEGLDEIVVELIRAKTENESLRQKLNELNKENFALKNETSSYKSIGLGLYVKKTQDDYVL